MPTAVAEPVGIPAPPQRDLYELARSLRLKSHDAILPLRYEIPTDYEVGHVEAFSVLTDVDTVTFGDISATLRNVSDNAYWYVQDGWRFDEGDLEEAVRVFEERILPQLTSYFGPLWPPGTPEGHRITILHARSRGLAGYFSSADEYPTLVHKNSNQQKMVYINPSVLRIGSSDYLSVLAHELQHAINWNVNGGQGSWLNEGLSQVAENLLNWSPPSVGSYIRSLPTSLVNWPISHENSSPYYGGSFLFSQFLVDQYGSSEGLGDLLATGGSGIVAVNSYLNSLGTDDDFESLFGRWAVANYLGQTGDGPYEYREFWPTAKPTDVLGQVGAYSFSQPQYSAQYLLIDSDAKDLEVEFSGNTHTPLLAVDPSEGGHCWWGNRGDTISATLTREFDLSNVAQATLRFTIWFRIEENWDYAYVQVSTDGGSTWDILQGGLSSSDNPSGNSYGPGYTGITDDWVEDSVDLSPYVGKRVLVRFHYVTDDAINGTGICLDTISVPELGFLDSVSVNEGWTTNGFYRTDNRIPQKYAVYLVETNGDEKIVTPVDIDESNRGKFIVSNLQTLDEAVLVVGSLAEGSDNFAEYNLTLRELE